MSMGINYYEMGKIAGKNAIEILTKNKTVKDFPVMKMENLDIDINEDTMKKLNLNLNKEVLYE